MAIFHFMRQPVGTLVGTLVGKLVGARVRISWTSVVGTAVGTSVGTFVGISVGTEEGSSVRIGYGYGSQPITFSVKKRIETTSTKRIFISRSSSLNSITILKE